MLVDRYYSSEEMNGEVGGSVSELKPATLPFGKYDKCVIRDTASLLKIFESGCFSDSSVDLII